MSILPICHTKGTTNRLTAFPVSLFLFILMYIYYILHFSFPLVYKIGNQIADGHRHAASRIVPTLPHFLPCKKTDYPLQKIRLRKMPPLVRHVWASRDVLFRPLCPSPCRTSASVLQAAPHPKSLDFQAKLSFPVDCLLFCTTETAVF